MTRGSHAEQALRWWLQSPGGTRIPTRHRKALEAAGLFKRGLTEAGKARLAAMKEYNIEMQIRLPCTVSVTITYDGEEAHVVGAKVVDAPRCSIRDVYTFGDVRVLDDRALEAWSKDNADED